MQVTVPSYALSDPRVEECIHNLNVAIEQASITSTTSTTSSEECSKFFSSPVLANSMSFLMETSDLRAQGDCVKILLKYLEGEHLGGASVPVAL